MDAHMVPAIPTRTRTRTTTGLRAIENHKELAQGSSMLW